MPAKQPSMQVSAPAKLNLILRVIGKRDDGFHELRMLNTAVDICDTVEVAPSGEDIKIECDHPDVPLDQNNLCHKAAEVFFSEHPESRSGLKISIKKSIPVAGGLGGGSSDAAAVLFALARLSGVRAGQDEMIQMGARVSADVPFFLFSSPAWAGGIGEVLQPAPAIRGVFFLVAGFEFGVYTARVFKELDLTSSSKGVNLKPFGEEESLPLDGPWINDLEPVVVTRHPRVLEVKEALYEAGAKAALMSGSGPTVFGAFHGEEEASRAGEAVSRSFAVRARVARAINGPIIRESRQRVHHYD